MAKKYCYLFTEGNAKMRELLGGKGANLAEMTNLGLPVPQGFTITTEACTQYYEDGKKINDEIIGQIMEYIEKMEEITGKTIPCINMVGGGIQDELLCELTAKAKQTANFWIPVVYGHAPLVNGLFLMNLDRDVTHIHSVSTKGCKVDMIVPHTCGTAALVISLLSA